MDCMKIFVPGPLLHEEIEQVKGGRDWNETVQKECLESCQREVSGEDAAKFYEEVIKLPSESHPHKIQSRRNETNFDKKIIKSKIKTSMPKPEPKPTLNDIMKLCQSDDDTKLSFLHESNKDLKLNEQDEFGWTPLMCAACAGSVKCVRLLLQWGVDLQICDRKGLTALDLAKMKKNAVITKMILKSETTLVNKVGEGISCKKEKLNDARRDVKSFYCQPCKVHYSDSKKHDNSIPHILATGSNNEPQVRYGIPESNRGFQMLVRTGWNKAAGLGPQGQGKKYPVKTVLKRDRHGLGVDDEKCKAKVTHFGPFDTSAVIGPSRERKFRESTLLKKERLSKNLRERRKEARLRREFSGL